MDLMIWDEELKAANATGKGGFLVVEDGVKHLPTMMDGKVSSRLMGAAWAALHDGFRGKKYEGPQKDKALAKLKRLYKKMGMTLPTEKSAPADDDTDDGTPMTALEFACAIGVPECKAITDAPDLRERGQHCCGNCNVFKYLPHTDATAWTQDGKVDIYLPTQGACDTHECQVDSNWVCDDWKKWEPEPAEEIDEARAAQLKAITIDTSFVKKLQPIKMIGETRFAGYGCYFAKDAKELDLVGTHFLKTTDLGEHFDKAPILYHHGLVKAFETDGKIDHIAKTVKAQLDDIGVWLEGDLDRSKKYWTKIKANIERGIYYFSGGSAEHLIRENESRALTSFPIIEWSLTPTPAEWRLGAGTVYKSLGIDLDNVPDSSGDSGKTSGAANARPSSQKPANQKREVRNEATPEHLPEVVTMELTPEQLQAQIQASVKSALDAQAADAKRAADEAKAKAEAEQTRQAEIKAEVDKQVAAFKASLPADPTQRPGYAQFHVNSRHGVGEFSWAKACRGILLEGKNYPNPWGGAEKERDIMRNHANEVRSTLAEGVGSLGGYLVPPQYMQDQFIPLLRARSVVRGAGPRVLQVNSDVVYIPSQATGATAYWVGENSAITPSNLSFGQTSITIKKLAALEYISNELLADASPSADQLIREDLAAVVAIKEDQTFLLSNGAAPTWTNAPVGMVNYPSVQQHTLTGDVGNGIAPTVAFPFAMKLLMMQANVPADGWAWFFSPRTFDEVAQFKDSQNRYMLDTLTGGNIADYQGYGQYPEGPETSFKGSVQGKLLGYPVFVTANITDTNTKGASTDCSFIVLARMADVIICERMGLELMATNVAGNAFAYDQTYIRAIERVGFGLRHAAGVVYADGVR